MRRPNGFGAALAAGLAALAVTAAPAAADGPVFPFTTCVGFDVPDNVITAVFGYYSPNTDAVEIDTDVNFFTPDPANRGQPALFFPGAEFDAFEPSFFASVEPSITWHLGDLTTTANSTGVPTCGMTPDAAPLTDTTPTITGSAIVGHQLAANPGVFRGFVSEIDSQWQREANDTTWSDIGGATDSTYTPTGDDAGSPLRVKVTALSGGALAGHPTGQWTTVYSAATAPVGAAPAGAWPTISGTARVGQTLTASPGSWTDVSSFAYDWQRCTTTSCASTGATAATYALTSADTGYFMRVGVTPSGETAPLGVSAETMKVTAKKN